MSKYFHPDCHRCMQKPFIVHCCSLWQSASLRWLRPNINQRCRRRFCCSHIGLMCFPYVSVPACILNMSINFHRTHMPREALKKKGERMHTQTRARSTEFDYLWVFTSMHKPPAKVRTPSNSSTRGRREESSSFQTHIRPADVSKRNASAHILRERKWVFLVRKKGKIYPLPSFLAAAWEGKYNATDLSLIRDTVVMTGSVFEAERCGKRGAA